MTAQDNKVKLKSHKPLVLRRMLGSDLETVIAIEEQAYPHPWTIGIFSDCLRNGYLCGIYHEVNHIHGYLIMSVAVGEAHILNLCIRPESQRQGLGRTLLQQAEKMARERLADNCYLEVRMSNAAAIHLYLSAGFQRIGLRKNYYPNTQGREHAVVMKKELRPLTY